MTPRSIQWLLCLLAALALITCSDPDTEPAPTDTASGDVTAPPVDGNVGPDAISPEVIAPDATVDDAIADVPACVPTTCDSGLCEAGSCCIAICTDVPCGESDGCEGVCGEGSDCCDADCSGVVCGESNACGAVCEDGSGCCTPDCAGVSCGDADGCGGVCDDGEGCCDSDCSAVPCGEFNGCGVACEDGSGCCVGTCDDKVCGQSDGCADVCEAGSGCCTDACAVTGQSSCVDATTAQTCGDYDEDPCLEWSDPAACAVGECVGGECAPLPTCDVPEAIIGGAGATGNGACDGDNMLLDDGIAAEFWGGTDNTWDQGGVPVSKCLVVDFGALCEPSAICVEAWAGESGCSGDTCDGPCELCKETSATALDIFAYKTNSTMSYEYQFSMYVDATSDPGQVQCGLAGSDPIRYVLVCRAACSAASMNAYVDYVYLE